MYNCSFYYRNTDKKKKNAGELETFARCNLGCHRPNREFPIRIMLPKQYILWLSSVGLYAVRDIAHTMEFTYYFEVI